MGTPRHRILRTAALHERARGRAAGPSRVEPAAAAEGGEPDDVAAEEPRRSTVTRSSKTSRTPLTYQSTTESEEGHHAQATPVDGGGNPREAL